MGKGVKAWILGTRLNLDFRLKILAAFIPKDMSGSYLNRSLQILNRLTTMVALCLYLQSVPYRIIVLMFFDYYYFRDMQIFEPLTIQRHLLIDA